MDLVGIRHSKGLGCFRLSLSVNLTVRALNSARRLDLGIPHVVRALRSFPFTCQKLYGRDTPQNDPPLEMPAGFGNHGYLRKD